MTGRRGRGPRPVAESIPRLLGRLGATATPATMEAVFARWEELVGPELGTHLRPLRVDGRALVVAVEHPAWATRARMESGQFWPGSGSSATPRSIAWRSWSSAPDGGVTVLAGDRS